MKTFEVLTYRVTFKFRSVQTKYPLPTLTGIWLNNNRSVQQHHPVIFDNFWLNLVKLIRSLTTNRIVANHCIAIPCARHGYTTVYIRLYIHKLHFKTQAKFVLLGEQCIKDKILHFAELKDIHFQVYLIKLSLDLLCLLKHASTGRRYTWCKYHSDRVLFLYLLLIVSEISGRIHCSKQINICLYFLETVE